MGQIQNKGNYVSPQTLQRHEQQPVDPKLKVKGTSPQEKTEKLEQRDQDLQARFKRNKSSETLNSKYNKAQIMKLKAQIDQVAPPDIQVRSYKQPFSLKSFFAPLAQKKTWQTVGDGIVSGMKGLGKGLFYASNLIRVPLSQTVRLIGAGAVKVGLANQNTLWQKLHTKSEALALTPYKESSAIFKQADVFEAQGKALQHQIGQLDREINQLETQLATGPTALQLAEAKNSRKMIVDRANQRGVAPNPNELKPIDDSISQLETRQTELSTRLQSMQQQRQSTQDKLTQTTQTVGDLRAIATRIRAGDTLEKALYVASYTRSVGQAVNFVALSSEAARNGHSLDTVIQKFSEITTGKGQPLISQTTLGALGIAGGTFAIASEAYDMYKSGKSLKEGLERRDKVNLMLSFNKLSKTDQQKDLDHDKSQLVHLRSANKQKTAQLAQKISQIDEKIELANQKGDTKAVKKLNEERMKHFVERGELHFQETQLTQKIDMKEKLHTQGMSQETEAVLHQLDSRVDGKFKIAKMVRNVVGMAAGGAAVAAGLVAVGAITVGALLTPVGWALAGAALVGTIGFGIASLVKQASRASKVTQVQANQQQIDLKRQELQKTATDLEQNLQTAKTRLQNLNPQESERLNRAQTEQRLIGAQLLQLRSGGEVSLELGDLSPERQKLALKDPGNPEHLKTLFEAQLVEDHSKATDRLRTVERDLGVNVTEIEAAQLKNMEDQFVLQGYEDKNQLQLLATDPKAAKAKLLEGIKNKDPEMMYIAENILKLRFSDVEVSNQIMINRIEDAFSMDPGK